MPFPIFAKRSRKQDMMLLSGWLFADLLLGLTVIFMAAIPPRPPVLPTIRVDPTVLLPTDTLHCPGGTKAPCWVKLTEDASSEKPVKWKASSDMSDSDNTVQFSPANGSHSLKPGQSVVITISHFPCQNGSFTFEATPNELNATQPAVTKWQCKPTKVRLDAGATSFQIHIDAQRLLAKDSLEIDSIKQQLKSQPALQNRSVGIAIVFGGAPTDSDTPRAEQIASAIYYIMGHDMQSDPTFTAFQGATYYDPLFYLGKDPSIVTIDVYLFQQ